MSMKNTILTGALILSTITVSIAQSNQVQNAFNYLKSKEYDKAKASADAASVNSSTSNSAKLWMYRGKIYKAIYEDKEATVRNIDLNAEEKALESFSTCLKLDKGSDIYKEEVKGLIVQSSFAVSQKAKYLRDTKEFDKSITCWNLLTEALPYDFDQGMKRNNVTKESVMFGIYKTYLYANNKEKAREACDKLIDIKYKDATIYTDMAKLMLSEKDTAKALTYIEKGKAVFEDNTELINTEINIYLAQGKLAVLKDKLIKATEVTPDNEVLHCVLANIYNSNKEEDKAVEEYKKAIELKPDYELANYNLGVIYFSRGKVWMDKVNALSLKEEAKAKEYEAKAKEEFKSAVQYLEVSYEISPDKRTKQTLFQLFSRLGEPEKAAKYAKDKQ